MKVLVLIIFLLPAFCFFSQNPIIIGDSIICSDGEGVLSTSVYESYQWFRRGLVDPINSSNPIPGENNQSLQMDYYNYAATYIKVQVVTLNNDTLMSEEFFVDGYMFNSPTLLVEGDFQPINDGDFLICAGDSLLLTLMDPYNVNIEWYKDGVLMNENEEILYVSEPGYYEVYGAPEICPNYIQTPGFGVELILNYDCNLSIENNPNEILSISNPVISEVVIVNNKLMSEFEIFDINTRMIKKGKIENNRIDVSDLHIGVYIILIDHFAPLRIIKI